jgi:mevalonate kinase
MLTGEYFVLKGATAFAVPSRMGQFMEVKKGRGSDIKWNAVDPDGNTWFKGVCSLFDMKFEKSTDKVVAEKLSAILNEACRLNSDFLSQWYGFKVTTKLEFSRDWGLGSSSSLVYCIAQWADVEPYELYDRTFGGSGYDIACARADSPLLFTRKEEEIKISYLDFNPGFADNLHFVFLGRKQDSREAIAHFEGKSNGVQQSVVEDISQLSRECAESATLKQFCNALEEVEKIVSAELGLKRIQEEYFGDFQGTVKSLGAWGGDFALVASPCRLLKLVSTSNLKVSKPSSPTVNWW